VLTRVGGSLDIRAEGAQLPVLTSVCGYLDISAEGAQLPVLTSVGGYLYISAEGAQLPVLTSVGGYLYISAEGAQLPVLISVGGYLDIRAEGAQLPVLTSVGGYLIVTREESIAALDKVREIILDNQARLAMDHWHSDSGWVKRTCAEEATCGTTHCLAGWLQVCSTKPELRNAETIVAGAVLAPQAAMSGMFFESNKRALKWLQEREYAA
jgi:hypothetical protein